MKIYCGIVNILMYTFPWSCTTAETDGVRRNFSVKNSKFFCILDPIIQPFLGSKIVEKTGKERLYKNVWKLGRNGLVEPASIVFNTSFKYTSSKPYDWSVNCDSFLQHIRQSFGFARQSVTIILSMCLICMRHKKQFFRKWARQQAD